MISFFHLLNDYSGSSRILSNVIYGLFNTYSVVGGKLYTSDTQGALDSSGIEKHTFHYRFSSNIFLTFIRYFKTQCRLFILALNDKNRIFYINTILPVSAALAGKMMGKKIIYHYHENAFAKGIHYRFLAWIMQRIADRIICVSQYQADNLRRKDGVFIVPNALKADFIAKLHPDSKSSYDRQTVLMLSSLKQYKGIQEFIELSYKLSQYKFVLVINADEEEIQGYLMSEGISLSSNIRILPKQDDVSNIYNNASIVLNLTNPDYIIETFGLTAIEAMAAGLPVIVPPEGGISELVQNGVNGYKISVHDLEIIANRIEEILSDFNIYRKLSSNALAQSSLYKEENMINSIRTIIWS